MVSWIDSRIVDKHVKFVPTQSDIEKMISQARKDEWLLHRFPDTTDYLVTLRETLAPIGETNRLEGDADVNLAWRYIVLHTER